MAEGYWLVGDDGCRCPLYMACIQFEPPEGCANCDEQFSKFYPQQVFLCDCDMEKAREAFLSQFRQEDGTIVVPEPDWGKGDEEYCCNSGCKDGILPCGWDD